MKPKRQMRVYRLQDGEVAAGIVDDRGELLDVKYFGKFTEEQYASLRKVIDRHARIYGTDRSDAVPPDKGDCGGE